MTALSAPAHGLVEATRQLRSEGFRFLLVGSALTLSHLSCDGFGVPLEVIPVEVPHPEGWEPTQLLETYSVLNGLVFGPRGLPLPRWVLVDLAIMPSALVIAAAPRSAVEACADRGHRESVDRLMADAEQRGLGDLVPVAAYCAAPTPDRSRWVGWSLCSIIRGRALGSVVKALALGAYGARRLDGVTQFDNPALSIHSRFGPLTIHAAQMPLHDAPRAFVYVTDLSGLPERLEDLLIPYRHDVVPSGTDILLDPRDDESRAALQRAILGGIRYSILPPGWVNVGEGMRVPIRELAS